MRSGNIKMTFSCNQDWNDMAPSHNGRYCHVCHKHVHDFTGKSLSEIKEFTKGRELCGMFSAEQVEPGLIPLEIPRQHLLAKAFFAIGTICGLHVNDAGAHEASRKNAIEIVDTLGRNECGVVPAKEFKTPDGHEYSGASGGGDETV